jgi:predicted transposase YdaD
MGMASEPSATPGIPGQAEELMSGFMKEYIEKGRQQGEAKGRAEGRAEGQAKAVLQVLKMRGVHVDLKSSERILSCTDLATLELWLERAMKATSVSQVLADPNH